MNKKRMSGFMMLFMAFILAFAGVSGTSKAAMPGTSALDHYNKYGEKILYMDDGYIYFAERLKRATSGIRWHTIGWRVKVTSNGRTYYEDYSTGEGYASGFTTRDPALAYKESTSDGYYYQRYGLNYNYLIRDIAKKNATLGRDMSDGDHDVTVVFDSINEVYDAVNNRTLRGPTYTAASTKNALEDYGMGTSLVDDAYGIGLNIDQLQLPIVRYRDKDISFPNGGGYSSTETTYYVQPGKLVYLDSVFRSQKVNLEYQYFKLGDPDDGSVSAVDDYSHYYRHSDRTFVESSASGNVTFSESRSSGPSSSNANTDSRVRQAFTLTGSGDAWYAYGEARNTNDIYYGGYDRTYKLLYVLRTDGADPTISGKPSSAWSDTNVSFSPTVSDPLSGIKNVKYYKDDVLIHSFTPTVKDTGYTLPSQTASSSATYKIVATDNVGNSVTSEFDVRIDKIMPTINLNYNGSWTNQNVPISWSAGDTGGSGVKNVVLPNGVITTATSGTYTATTSGTQSFIVTDNAGNIKAQDIVVNIDKTSPTASKSQTPTAWTDGGVTLNLTGVSDTGGSGLLNIVRPNGSTTTGTSASETVYANGTYTFDVNDRAGNTSSYTFTVSNIDTSAPNGNVSQTPTGYAPNGVTISLTGATDTGGSGVKGIRLPNGTFVSGTSASQLVTNNGTYTFQVEDNAGNVTNKSITVSNITAPDSIAPTGNATQTPSSWTNGNVTLNLTGVSDTGGSGLKSSNTIKLPNGTFVSGTSASQTVTTNGNYVFEMYDNEGNVGTANVNVTNIDKTAPTASISQNPTGWTDSDVVLTLSSIADTGGSGLATVTMPDGTSQTTFTNKTYTVTSNGTYTFKVEDRAGNEITRSITVTNIDKTAPTGTLSQTPTGWTNGNVTLNLTGVSDAGGSGFKNITLPNGTTTSSTTASQVVTTNGTYSFKIEDNAGNITTRTITVANIDKTMPTANNPTQTPTTPTNGNVTISMTGAADGGGSGFKQITLPNGTVVTTSTASQVVTANGTYIFDVEDNAGNVTNKSITVSNIDKTAPTGNLNQTPTTPTNGNVTLNLTGVADTGGSGLDSIKLPDGTFVSGTSASYNVSTNGTYSFVIYDNAGNATTKTITVTNIDKVAPTGNLAQTPSTPTNGNVTLNLTSVADTGGSGFKNITLPNGTVVTTTTASQVVTANGTYTFEIEDNAGNVTNKSITVSNIDKTAPTGTLSQTPTTWTNGNVTLNLTGVADTGGSGFKNITLPNGTVVTTSTASQVVTANGTYVFDIEDNAGNVTTKSITVTNIDKTTPIGTLSQTPTTPTNGNVTLNLTAVSDSGGSGFKNITLPNGTVVTTTTASQVVTANGTYTFDIEDNAGNVTTKSITVSNIDKVAPTGNLNQTPTTPTNGDVTLNLTGVADTGGSGFKNITLPNGTVVTTTTASQVVTTNGTYSFKIEDNVGNVTTKSIVVTNIDKTAPTGTLNQTPTTPTNGNVTLNLTGVADSGGSGFKNITLPNGTVVTTSTASQVVTANGTYTFDIEDNAGNVTSKTIVVTNIDKTAPTGTISQTPSTWTNGSVTLNLTSVSDTGGSGLDNIKLPNGTFVTGTSASFAVAVNGTYTFEIYDNAGNVTAKTIVVSNIENIEPTATLTQTPTTPTNGNVTLTLSSISDTGGSGMKSVRLPSGTVQTTFENKSVTVSSNGTYTFTLEDNAGNVSTRSITVSNIDKTAPTGNLAQTPTTWTNGDVTLNLTAVADSGGSGFKQITLPNGTVVTTSTASQVVTGNGTYTFRIEDNAGNITTKTIVVSNIDKVAPTGTTAISPSSWTNGNVNITLSGIGDASSGVALVTLPNGVTSTTTDDKVYTVSANGTYIFKIRDVAGNEWTRSVTVTNIDKVAPTGTLSQTPLTDTNGNVTLTLNGVADTGGSGFKQIKLPNGSVITTTIATVTATTNGTYTFEIEDNAGNVTTKSITVSNIDKVLPTASLSASTTAWTNQNVTLRLRSIADVGSGLANVTLPDNTVVSPSDVDYVVTGNGTYKFLISDNAGNVTTLSIVVSNIDKVIPGGTIVPDITTPTRQPVTLKVTGTDVGSGVELIELLNGNYTGRNLLENSSREVRGANEFVQYADISPIIEKYGFVPMTISFDIKADVAGSVAVYTQNGSSTKYGIGMNSILVNTSFERKSVTVTPYTSTASDIKSMLAFYGTYGSGRIVNVKNVKIELGSTESNYTVAPEDVVLSGNTKDFMFTDNGTYQFLFQDKAGNQFTKSYTISNIDKIAPTGNLAQTPTTWTNGNVTLNLTGVADVGGSGLKQITLPNGATATGTTASHVVSANGTYNFLIEDNAGNVTTKTITVTNIDKIAPTGNLAQTPTTWTNGNVTLNLTGVADTGGSGLDTIKLPNGTFVSGTSASYAVSVNGTYNFVIYDNAGNATTKTITVTNIDKTAPTGTLTQTPTTWTNGNVTLDLTNVSDTGGSGFKNITLPNGTVVTTSTASQVVTTNGTYTFKITDNAGNVTTETLTVTNIDKIIPTITVTPNGVAWKNTAQSVSVSLADTGGSAVKSWRYRTSSDDGVTYGVWSSLMSTTSGSVNLTGNGVYRIQVEVTDNAGNTQTVTTNAYQLDMVKPSITATPSTTSPTNANVTVAVSASDADSGIARIKLPDGTIVSASTSSYVISTNGTYTFEATDVAGNTETTVLTVSNIDKVKPTATLTQTPSSWTNGNVTLNLAGVADTGGSGLKTTGNIKLPNGTFVTGTSASQVVTVNGTYTFVVYDNAGNSENFALTVSNIDKVKPTGSTQLIPGTSALTIKFNGADAGSGVDSITLPNGVKVVGTTANYSTTTSGTYTATVLDRAGNTETVAVTINEPNATLQQEVTDWTNRKDYKLIVNGTPQYGSTLRIQAPFVSSTWTDTNRLETTITKNGSYTFVVNDGGIFKTLNVDVTNFDRVRPLIDIQEKNKTTNSTTANVRIIERGDVK